MSLVLDEQKISLLLSHIKDDSYTPQTLSIRAGTGKHDLTEASDQAAQLDCQVLEADFRTSDPDQVTTVHFDKPEGWQTIDLRESAGSGGGEDDEGYVPCFRSRLTAQTDTDLTLVPPIFQRAHPCLLGPDHCDCQPSQWQGYAHSWASDLGSRDVNPVRSAL